MRAHYTKELNPNGSYTVYRQYHHERVKGAARTSLGTFPNEKAAMLKLKELHSQEQAKYVKKQETSA